MMKMIIKKNYEKGSKRDENDNFSRKGKAPC